MSRRDDDLLDIPSIVPDTEGRSSRETTPRSAPKPSARSSNSTAPSNGLVRQMLLIFMFSALSLCCALLYYQNAQQSVLNDQLQKRLSSLESQLGVNTAVNASNGETLGEKVKQLDDNLKAADDEIRKLWGVTNDKNKKSLESHETRIAEHEKSLTTLQGIVGEMKKSVAQTEKSLSETSRVAAESNKAASDATQAISEMRSAVGALQQRVAQGDPQVREASQQAAMAQEQGEQLQVKLDTLSKRVTEHEESLRSIDSFRRSVNSDLGKLKGQSLQEAPASVPQ